jgi:hypothetical protein
MVNGFRSMRSLTSELMPDRPAGRRAGQPHDPRTLSELSSTSSSPSLAQLDAFVDPLESLLPLFRLTVRGSDEPEHDAADVRSDGLSMFD